MRSRLTLVLSVAVAWLGAAGLDPALWAVPVPLVLNPLPEVESLDQGDRSGDALAAAPSRGWEADLRDFRDDLRGGRLQRIGALGAVHLLTRPDDPELNGLYAVFLAAQGDTAKAAEHLEKARKAEAAASVAGFAESMIRRQKGDVPGAILTGRQAVGANPEHPFGWNVLGRALLDAGDRTNALSGFRRAVELSPSFYSAHLNVGAVTLQLGDASGAAAAFGRAAQLDAKAAAPRLGLALSLETLGDTQAALAQLREGLRHHPEDRHLLPKLTEIQLRLGQTGEAYTNAVRLERLGVPGSGALLADASLRRGDYAGAETHLGKIPENDPTRSYLNGYRLLATSHPSEALAAMEKTLALQPGHPGAALAAEALRLSLGKPPGPRLADPGQWPASVRSAASFLNGCLQSSRTNWPVAFDHFRAAAGFLPGFSMDGIDAGLLAKALPPGAAADLGLGVLFLMKGMPEAARVAFERILPLRPRSFMGNYWLGVVTLEKGDRAQARSYFARSLEEAPTFFAGLFATGELAFTSGETAVGADHYRRAQAIKPEAGLSMRLGVYYDNTGDAAKAEEQYRQVVALAPQFYAGYNQLAWFLARRGQKLDEAFELAQRADGLRPGNAGILDTLGWIHHLQKRPDLALQHLRRAAEINPSSPTIGYHLGAVLHAAKKDAEARDALEKALALTAPFPDRETASRLLESLPR